MGLPEIPYDEWFHDEKPHPHDSMPIARDFDNPRPEEEIADNYSSRHESTPEFEKSAEEIVTMHEKMYRIATSRNNPFHVGASENVHADIDYIGGSENVQEN
tara:strand:+ start:366 stop:671 length:306 start_codon:yes stop_codon:yes gene_type:complete